MFNEQWLWVPPTWSQDLGPFPKRPSQRWQCSQVEARGLGLWAPGSVGHALLAGSWPYNVSCPKRPLKEHSCYTVGCVPGPADSRLCSSCESCWCQCPCRHRKKGPSRDLLFIQLRLYDQITQIKCSLLPGVVFGYENKLPCLGDFVFSFLWLWSSTNWFWNRSENFTSIFSQFLSNDELKICFHFLQRPSKPSIMKCGCFSSPLGWEMEPKREDILNMTLQ